MGNDFVNYYDEHKISPVKQNIADIEKHYERRRKLYRQCGIPTMTFKGAEILEIGPGGGYNTLAFFHWGCNHVDLVEANHTGIEDMKELFFQRNIKEGLYDIYECMIEDFKSDKKYNIIIAEGFLPYLSNKQEIINKMKMMLSEDGIIVVTCADDVCVFIELMKRLFGFALAKDIESYEEKVDFLADIFLSQLNSLKGFSRTPRQWVWDVIFNPVLTNGEEMSISQAISLFGDDVDVLGSSPSMFTDYSWYKDIDYDYKRDWIEQFSRKRLALIMAGLPEQELDEEFTTRIVNGLKRIKRLENEYEKNLDTETLYKIIEQMDRMDKDIKMFNEDFYSVWYEIKQILSLICEDNKFSMEEFIHFSNAFGRGMQYIAFMKKDE